LPINRTSSIPSRVAALVFAWVFFSGLTALGATFSASNNPVKVAYGLTSGTVNLSWNATDFQQAGGYTGYQVRLGSSTGGVVCSSGSPTGSCGVTVDHAQSLYLVAIYYSGTPVTAGSLYVSVVDSLPSMGLGVPDTTTTYIAPVIFGGWALDHVYPISYVNVKIDGINQGNATYGGNRADACQQYPAAQSCPNVGYSMWFDPATVSTGTHTIIVTAVDTQGDSTIVQRTFKTQQPTISINVDNPNQSQNQYILGQTTMFGWAIDDVSAISSITIAIDGTNRGNATYGGSRPDVCQTLGNHPGCPNVGWQFAFDTAYLSGGSHALDVTAVTASGRQRTVRFTLNVQQAITTIGIGSPNPSQTYTGTQGFGGFAIDNANTITNVVAVIDGHNYAASYGGNRPDVCTNVGNYPGCPNVGWNVLVNTAALRAGALPFTLIATTSDGRQTSQTTTLNVLAPVIHVNTDAPSINETVTGALGFGGWAFDTATNISSVTITVDGINFGGAIYGGSRADVCTALGNYPGCPNVGWNAMVDTSALPNGAHTLIVTATTSDSRTQTQSRPFYSVNVTPILPTSALSPMSPKKDYIRQGGRMIAIENKP
jgi:hypothetical protein